METTGRGRSVGRAGTEGSFSIIPSHAKLRGFCLLKLCSLRRVLCVTAAATALGTSRPGFCGPRSATVPERVPSGPPSVCPTEGTFYFTVLPSALTLEFSGHITWGNDLSIRCIPPRHTHACARGHTHTHACAHPRTSTHTRSSPPLPRHRRRPSRNLLLP